MKLMFICPVYNRIFESAAFHIVENKGIVPAANGGKTLDAKVALDEPCPFCGNTHVFRAEELPCPLTGRLS
ncbi:hypothetical protein [Desulfosudis oleivorans]|uniref:Uncharacterized protein n=1 Tax=Desulfosudis oleivorans (strain DSM 6200 / JCM 39069 / Hxd3) TaxID=96561 RepID=A9A0C8_DESOH|nr:hypothetical protein [Desulfosudis oleivorans]ABW69047.1 conserved hypothetical protein [Desulfosudis oleivorans Hxd3]